MTVDINLLPILQFGIIILAIFGGCFLLNNLFNFIRDLFYKNADSGITNNLIDKSLFCRNPRELAKENNREIQSLTEDVATLKKDFKEINKKLDYIVEELTKRG